MSTVPTGILPGARTEVLEHFVWEASVIMSKLPKFTVFEWEAGMIRIVVSHPLIKKPHLRFWRGHRVQWCVELDWLWFNISLRLYNRRV